MKKPNFSQIATKTIEQEQQAVTDRFSKADEILLKRPFPQSLFPITKPAAPAPAVASLPKPKEKKKTGPKPGEPRIKDIFSFPENDHALIEKTRQRTAKHGTILNKSQVVRLALLIIDHLKEAEFETELKLFVQKEMGHK